MFKLFWLYRWEFELLVKITRNQLTYTKVFKISIVYLID